MARDIVQSALLEAKRAREVAMENAKDVLIESLSPRLERALDAKFNRLHEEDEIRTDGEVVHADVEGDEDEWVDGSVAGEASGSELTEDDEFEDDEDIEVDAADAEAEIEVEPDYDLGDEEVEENDEWGGDKGDESSSHRDYESVYIDDDEDLDIDVDDEDDDVELDIESFFIEDDEEDEDVEDTFESYRPRRRRTRKSRTSSLKVENTKLRKAYGILRKELRESNLFNVKLSHALRLLESNGGALTGKQRKRIVSTLDRAKTVREAHLIAKSIHESLKVAEGTPRRKRIHESASRKNKAASLIRESAGGPTDRWSRLAGITS